MIFIFVICVATDDKYYKIHISYNQYTLASLF